MTVGLALGDRLTGPGFVGVMVALVSVVLLTRTAAPVDPDRTRSAPAMAYAALAGVSFGVFLVLLAQTSSGSGLWPLAGARCASLSLVAGLALLCRESLRLTGPTARLAVLAGVLDMASNVLFLVAVRAAGLLWSACWPRSHPWARSGWPGSCCGSASGRSRASARPWPWVRSCCWRWLEPIRTRRRRCSQARR